MKKKNISEREYIHGTHTANRGPVCDYHLAIHFVFCVLLLLRGSTKKNVINILLR